VGGDRGVTTLGEKPPSKYIKALVFGRSKIGKTFGAGTFPRPAFIDCDKGIGALASPDFIKLHGWRPEIEYEQFTERNVNPRGVPQGHNAFDDVCRYFDKLNSPAMRDKWDTLVTDTGTSLSAYAMNKAIVLLGGTFKGVTSGTLAEALTHGLVFPKIQDYGSERSMVEQFIAMCYDLDKNFLFLCHEKEITDKEGNPTAITPLLTGKGVEAISALFDEVWNVRIKKVGPDTVRYLQTKPDGIRMCGSRNAIADGTPWDYPSVAKEWERVLKLRGKPS
jgi:AAA domain